MVFVVLVPTLVAGLGVTAITSAYLWFRHPALVLKLMLKAYLYKAGLRTKLVQAGKFTFSVAVRGKPAPDSPSMLCLHGFSASKDMWVSIIQKLPSDAHIVVFDLPGHGETLPLPDDSDDVSPKGMAHITHQLVEVLGLNSKPFHLLGTSMGGAIAANYAVEYPEDLECLTLICPAMKTPTETAFMQEIRDGVCRLLPQTPEEVQIMLDSCVYKKHKFPKQILKGILEIREPKAKFNERLFYIMRDLEKEGNVQKELEEKMAHMKVPTQVIWGQNDELMHISGAEMMRETLPNCQRIDIIEKCGHSINMDRPGTVARNITAFRDSLQN